MLALVGRLRALLNPTNAHYLDVMLQLLTDQSSPIYATFWKAFNKKMGHGDTVVSPAAGAAWNALRDLHGIVKEYRSG
jgi:hypothetical protein